MESKCANKRNYEIQSYFGCSEYGLTYAREKGLMMILAIALTGCGGGGGGSEASSSSSSSSSSTQLGVVVRPADDNLIENTRLLANAAGEVFILGRAARAGVSSAPVFGTVANKIDGLINIKNVHLTKDYFRSFVIDNNGIVYGWGSNYNREFGGDSAESQFSPVKMSGWGAVADIQSCQYYGLILMLKMDGTLSYSPGAYTDIGPDRKNPSTLGTVANLGGVASIASGMDSSSVGATSSCAFYAVTNSGDTYDVRFNRVQENNVNKFAVNYQKVSDLVPVKKLTVQSGTAWLKPWTAVLGHGDKITMDNWGTVLLSVACCLLG